MALKNQLTTFFRRDVGDVEWPTILLAILIYSGMLALTYFWNRLSAWLILPLGAWLGAWHMSLQHELIHGHPTRSQRLNDALGFMPIMLWMPYFRYKDTHLQHHRAERLTDPLQDPESAYHSPKSWRRMSRLRQWLHLVSVTFTGRLVIGPFVAISSFWSNERELITARQPGIARIWVGHMAGAALVLGWLVLVCHVSLLSYAVLVVWPGTGLVLLRSLAEHRDSASPQDRTAIVEHGGPLAILYLYNNLHVVHHLYPGLPWYRLPARWRQQRGDLLRVDGAAWYRSYLQVAALFWATPHNRGAATIEQGDTPPKARRSACVETWNPMPHDVHRRPVCNDNCQKGLTMFNRRRILFATILYATIMVGPALANASAKAHVDVVLDEVVASEIRPPSAKARDVYRHPAQSLRFWGLKPGDTLIEVQPGSGWWTDILAPYLARTGGRYIAAGADLANPRVSDGARKDRTAFEAKYAGNLAVFGSVSVVGFGPTSGPLAAPGSVDLVLVSREAHNWVGSGFIQKAFADFYLALKPGGILAVEEHRAPAGADPLKGDGYLSEDYVIAQARKASFVLAARSDINANPRDTKDYPFGVWTLPPTRLSAPMGQAPDPGFDHTKYDAIGESDRMTLKFVKRAG